MRSFSILGDSISTFDGCNPDGFTVYYQGERCEQTGVTSSADTWWSQVIERLGGRLLANSSFSGSLVEGAGFPAGNSQERIDALHGVLEPVGIVHALRLAEPLHAEALADGILAGHIHGTGFDHLALAHRHLQGAAATAVAAACAPERLLAIGG